MYEAGLSYDGNDSGAPSSFTGSSAAASMGSMESHAQQYQQQKAIDDYYKAMNYDHSDTNTYSSGDFNSDSINKENPYEKYVISGTYWYFNSHRQKVWVIAHKVNTGYTAFEENIFAAQKTSFNTDLESVVSPHEDATQLSVDGISHDYDNDRFGDTSNIDQLAQDVKYLEDYIYENEQKDILTSKYNRIVDADTSDLNKDAQDDLEEKKAQLKYAQALYDNKEFQAKLAELHKKAESQANNSNWIWDFFYKPPPDGGGGYKFGDSYNVDSKASLVLNTTNELNRWMAGGDLYDAPRAGDVLFNPIGDMNTVKFLGLQNKNFTPDLNIAFANPDVYKSLGVNAGDDNFSVL